ncbi:hypothetical protein CKO44_07605 [Rubrivivax gelatinosus]|uniref:hypothetical protein n=1 Tax=Rubrivivax gelatinosus TaxID=28068 RepID=UPI0019057A3E|nr:hypothetical protein [Rubrivivax gelatinosus]MBK1613334.1 hypothetical protein [Rubrivivax gelatinosus]MBZ8143119.1 hypothetical protein [Rubrivivax gelatinosus]
MDEDRKTLLLIKGVIADMPPAEAAKVQACAAVLRRAVLDAGDHGVVALALIGAEAQAMELQR